MNLFAISRPWRLVVLLSLLTPGFVQAEAAAGKTDAAAEIAKMEPEYQTALEAVKADHEKWSTALETWYTTALEKVLADRAQAGDLDGAVATKAERERFTAHTETTAEQIQKMPPVLRTVRGTYDANLKRVVEEVAKRTEAANQKHFTELEALQKRLTQSGEIDQALLIKAERQRLLNPPAPAPSAPIAAVPPAGPTPTVATTESKPAAPATTAEPTKATATEAMTALLGRWRMTNPANGWTGTRTFKADGTFTTDINTSGKWELDGDKVTISHADGGSEQMLLPLDPKDTKVKIRRNRTIGAVKETE